MGQLHVKRWTKGRHDRLYITTHSGTKVGWYDLRTQRQHLDIPGMWPQFQQEITRWRATHTSSASTPRPSSTRTPSRPAPAQHPATLPPADPIDGDLATRPAGHNAAAMADRLAPRSRTVRGLARLFGIRTRDRSWRTGAVGERAVGARLDTLNRRGWHVLHAVDLGSGGDIDHLLIGPSGVFTVNTKHHPGADVRVGRNMIWVRGHQQPYVTKASQEAQRVRHALGAATGQPVHVAPLIVMHRHRHLRGWLTHRPQGVQVLPSAAAAWWWRLPGRTILTPNDIERLYTVARRPTTWTHA